MYSASLTIPKDKLLAIRNAPTAARTQFTAKMDKVVRPAVQAKVDQVVAVDPGPVVSGPLSPFQFATDKSRRFYFAAFKGLIPYQRTGDLLRAWVVTFDRRLADGQLIIRNVSPVAGYVYGPGSALASFLQVPGHARTGWGRNLPAALSTVQVYAIDLIASTWTDTVKEVLA